MPFKSKVDKEQSDLQVYIFLGAIVGQRKRLKAIFCLGTIYHNLVREEDYALSDDRLVQI